LIISRVPQKKKEKEMKRKEYEATDDLVLLMDAPEMDAELEHEAFRLNTEIWLDQVLGLTDREGV
jgi:hypothetical protein